MQAGMCALVYDTYMLPLLIMQCIVKKRNKKI